MIVNPFPPCPACGADMAFVDSHTCLTTVPDRRVLRAETKSLWDDYDKHLTMPKYKIHYSGQLLYFNHAYLTNIAGS